MLPFVLLAIENDADRDFMAELFVKYQRLMLKTIDGVLGDPTDAEDVLQTTVVKLIDKLELLRDLEEKPRVSYLVTAARHTAVSHLREVKRRTMPSLDAMDWLEQELSLLNDPVEEAILHREELTAMGVIWSDLDRRSRYLLEGRYILELSFEELAEDLGIQEDSARMELSRARRRAKDLLREKTAITSLL